MLRVVRVIALDTASQSEIGVFIDGVPTADLVVMVVPAGATAPTTTAQAAATIGRACNESRVMTTAIVVRTASTTDDALSKTLAQVRPWSLMVVVVSDQACVADILASFR